MCSIAGYDYPHSYDVEDIIEGFPDECPTCGAPVDVIPDEINLVDKTASVRCTNVECDFEDDNHNYGE